MGYASAGACFPTQAAALANWCSSVIPGDSAASCGSCDSVAGTCEFQFLDEVSQVVQVVTVPVSTPACEVFDPVAESSLFIGAALSLLVLAWAGRALYDMFRVPNA